VDCVDELLIIQLGADLGVALRRPRRWRIVGRLDVSVGPPHHLGTVQAAEKVMISISSSPLSRWAVRLDGLLAHPKQAVRVGRCHDAGPVTLMLRAE